TQPMSRRKPQDMVLAWCRASGTPCHDLLEEFENGDRRRLYYDYDLHWTAEGHMLAARSVAKFLAAEHLPQSDAHPEGGIAGRQRAGVAVGAAAGIGPVVGGWCPTSGATSVASSRAARRYPRAEGW